MESFRVMLFSHPDIICQKQLFAVQTQKKNNFSFFLVMHFSVAVAQVTSRLNLNWRGVAATSPGQSENAFFVMFIITVVHFVIIVATYIAIFTLDTNDYSQPVPINGWKQPIGIELFILHLHRFFKITYLVITARWLRMIRRVIRAKYAIPGENIMDLIAGYFCQCCAAAQMLRHTTDYNVYPSYTCSKTGLPDSVPFIV